MPVECSKTLLNLSHCSTSHRSALYTSGHLTFCLTYLYQKDERALPGNLCNRTLFLSPPLNAVSVTDCSSLLPLSLCRSTGLQMVYCSLFTCYAAEGLRHAMYVTQGLTLAVVFRSRRRLPGPVLLFDLRSINASGSDVFLEHNKLLHFITTAFLLNLNSVNQLIVVMVKCGVLFEVRTGFLNNI
jgi:hypothetical protein